MKTLLWIAAAIVLTPLAAPAAEPAKSPGIRDLDFLLGTWKVTALHYDVSRPETPGRPERGTKVCRWALETAGEPAFIVCENRSVYGGEDEEAYLEYINYNPYAGSFEKTNLFSGFPVKVVERLAFDPVTRVVEIRGRVEVENRTDTYVETWRFDEKFGAFDREALMNLSTMPLTEYRRIVSGRNVRAAE